MLAQQCVCHDADVANALCAAATLSELKVGDTLIQVGGHDNDIYFVLAGRVSIVVKGRELALRRAEQHVGEIAMIDRSSTRSASVAALETTVVAKVPEATFTDIANKHPFMWRCLANELGKRLREREKYVDPPNPRPVVFIGSSAEGVGIARGLQSGLSHDGIIHVWTDNVFTASSGTMERLEEMIDSVDFGVLVCTQDDRIVNDVRGIDTFAPRDNVILELGMCIGNLGRKRAYFVKPRTRDLKIPSDLLGITPLDYEHDGDPNTLAARLGHVCTEIRSAIRRLGPK
jgi:predicted nucleotide-binding protein